MKMSKKSIVYGVIIAVIYFLATIYIMNASLVKVMIFNGSSVGSKLSFMFSLLGGMWTAMSATSLVTLVFVSLLTGANVALVAQKISVLRASGSGVSIIFGGGTILGIAGGGCVACGLPILSLFGISGSVAYLPYYGAEISWFAIILLSISLYSLLKTSPQKVCVPT